MGLFFNNYNKPGPGVEKDGPKKRGVFLYFELLWRKLGKMFLSNMLYFLVSVPVILLYHFMSYCYLSMILPEEFTQNTTGFSQIVLILTVLLTILLGTGPVSCGYTFLMRSFAREEHVWMTSDFFEHTRKNFVQSLIVFIINTVLIAACAFSIHFYAQMAATMPFMKYLAYVLMIMLLMIFIMHFYIYEFIITFKVSIKDAYKNSLIMAFAGLPMNIFLLAFVVVVTCLAFTYLTPIAIILVAAIFWISFMRFPIDFYTARKIKRDLIDARGENE